MCIFERSNEKNNFSKTKIYIYIYKRSVGNFPGIFKSRIKGIDGGYKLSELLSGRGGSADAIVNVTVVEFRFWAVVLTKKLMFDKKMA